MQLREVLRATVREIGVRLRGEPGGTVDNAMRSASGDCSPPSTTKGFPAIRRASNPSAQS